MRTLKGAIIGFGFIAEHGHLPAYRAARAAGVPLEIIAIVDPCEPRRAKARALHAGARVYGSVDQLLAEERELDFVDITAPPYVHAEIATLSLSRGLHVMCEKPLARTRAEVLLMIDAAREHRRVLFPSHNYLHAPVAKAVSRAIRNGDIGRVKSLSLQTFRTTHARGVLEWNTHWRRQREFSGGGIAMDHGSHTFYLAFDWMGAYPTHVSATTSVSDDRDTEDTVVASLRFPTGLTSAHLTWTAGVRKVLYTIHGERGAIRVEDDELEIAKKVEGNGATSFDFARSSIASHWMDASHVTWFGTLFTEFLAAVEARDFIPRNARDGLACVSLTEGIYASARNGGAEVALPRD